MMSGFQARWLTLKFNECAEGRVRTLSGHSIRNACAIEYEMSCTKVSTFMLDFFITVCFLLWSGSPLPWKLAVSVLRWIFPLCRWASSWAGRSGFCYKREIKFWAAILTICVCRLWQCRSRPRETEIRNVHWPAMSASVWRFYVRQTHANDPNHLVCNCRRLGEMVINKNVPKYSHDVTDNGAEKRSTLYANKPDRYRGGWKFQTAHSHTHFYK